jgi:hypothetical protein
LFPSPFAVAAQHHDVVRRVEQSGHQMAPDETGRAGDEYPHNNRLLI